MKTTNDATNLAFKVYNDSADTMVTLREIAESKNTSLLNIAFRDLITNSSCKLEYKSARFRMKKFNPHSYRYRHTGISKIAKRNSIKL